MTLHRPANVDDPLRLSRIVDSLHRTRKVHCGRVSDSSAHDTILSANGLMARLNASCVRCCGPLGYIEFLSLEAGAGAVLTDSGGVQEETTALGVRCFTLRANTERPITVDLGTNELIGDDPDAIPEVGPTCQSPIHCDIPLWDGKAGERVARVVTGFVTQRVRRRNRMVDMTAIPDEHRAPACSRLSTALERTDFWAGIPTTLSRRRNLRAVSRGALARRAAIQVLKRAPVNLRPVVGVPASTSHESPRPACLSLFAFSEFRWWRALPAAGHRARGRPC